MYCIKCGKRIPEQSKFCPFCATNQLHPDLDDELEASDDQLASTDDKNQREISRDIPRNKASGKHGRKAVLIAGFAVGLVALVIGIVIASQSSLFNPAVREEQDAFKQLVTSDLEGTASQIGLASDWSSGEEPDVTSVTIDQIEIVNETPMGLICAQLMPLLCMRMAHSGQPQNGVLSIHAPILLKKTQIGRWMTF